MDNSDISDAKHFVDMVSMGAAVGTIIGILPAIAALFTIIWTGIRIWESNTVREWRGKNPYA